MSNIKGWSVLGLCVGAAILLASCGQLAETDDMGSLTTQAVKSATIDFESGLNPGDVVSSVSSGNGISGDAFTGAVDVFGMNPDVGGGATNVAVIFDATCNGGDRADCSGDNPGSDDDGDLLHPENGNILIVNEDDDFSDPDDADVADTKLTFDFSTFGPGIVEILDMTIFDVETAQGEVPAVINLYSGGSGGALLDSVEVFNIGNRLKATVDVNVTGVDYMEVIFQGSGAVDNIRIRAEVPDVELEGCTPGFWRQPFRYDLWTDYSPTDEYFDVFGVGPSAELGDTIKARGGGENAFLRHSTAALLNAAHPDLDYKYSVAEVLGAVQATYASGDFEAQKDDFDEANNEGCSFSGGPRRS